MSGTELDRRDSGRDPLSDEGCSVMDTTFRGARGRDKEAGEDDADGWFVATDLALSEACDIRTK